MPSFTHALLLRDGRVFAAGTKVAVITARRLSGAFGARISLRRHRGRFVSIASHHARPTAL
jgi:iron complex transport system ATP-binding protein